MIYRHKLQIKLDEEEGDESALAPVTPITTSQVPHGFVPEESQEGTSNETNEVSSSDAETKQ